LTELKPACLVFTALKTAWLLFTPVPFARRENRRKKQEEKILKWLFELLKHFYKEIKIPASADKWTGRREKRTGGKQAARFAAK
jgi:hypothetical protein